jgi:hypothetical protein
MRAVLLAALALAACDAASPDPGITAALQVAGAQFRPGPFPRDTGGPAALSLTSTHSEITIGPIAERVRGILDVSARGVALGIAGQPGAWLLPASSPDIDAPDNPTARATIGLAADFPIGPFTLLVAASDADGRFGAFATTEIIAADAPAPDGELVIGLYWDGRADLDLHVVDPLGGEAYSDHPNTWERPPPGEPVDPTAYLTGGILDHDGNKDCRNDGMPREHVIWQMPPPDGNYTVRVDTRAMCGDASAAWQVKAYRTGELVGSSSGRSVPDDVLLPHGKGAGVLALELACGPEGCTLR